MNNFTNDQWDEINSQFNKIKNMSEVEPDIDYAKELESLFNLDFEGMTKEFELMYSQKEIYIETLFEDVKTPKYEYKTDSGFDLISTKEVIIPPFGRSLIPTGIKLGIPEGTEIQVRPKSGLAINMGITVLNTPGTVDCGYTGEIKVIVFNTNNHEVIINKGMKIAQAVLCPVFNGKFVKITEVDSVGTKDRGNNGFGSTGI